MADVLSDLSKDRSDLNGTRGKTWVHDLFEGVLTNETRCICCETVRINFIVLNKVF